MIKHKQYFRDADYLDYYVNEKDRTIICKPNPYVGDDGLLRKLGEILFNDSWFANTLSDFYFRSNLRIPDSQFIGKAVCSPDDEWDYETGKALARARLEEKTMKLLQRVLNAYAAEVVKAVEPGLRKMKKYFQVMEDADAYKY